MTHVPTGRRCFYCDVELVRHQDKIAQQAKGYVWPDNLETSDHRVPRVNGGKEKVKCCYLCNIVKSHFPESFYVLRLIFWARKNPVAAKFLVGALEERGEIKPVSGAERARVANEHRC